MTELDILKITDYTTVTDLERFASYIENYIITWCLSLDEINNFSKIYSKDEFYDAKDFNAFNIDFSVELYIDNLACENLKEMYNNLLVQLSDVNFLSNSLHYIKQNYGIKNFILIKSKSDLDIISSEKMVKLLNSGINLAISDSKCVLPVFLQINEKIDNIYQGFFMNFGIRVIFDLVYFRNRLSHIESVSDFFKIFESKFKLKLRSDNTIVSSFKNVRTLDNLKIDQIITDEVLLNEQTYDDLVSIKVKFGSQINFLNKIIKKLNYIEYWEKINGTSWLDQLFYYSFKPFHSKRSEINLKFNNDIESIILQPVFYSFDNLLYLSEYWTEKKINSFVQCLNENSLYDKIKKIYRNIREVLLDFFLIKNDKLEFIDQTYAQFTSCNSNNIVFRFAFFVHNLFANHPDLDILIVFLWNDLVQQLRRYYEYNEQIPCVDDTKMDYKSCLLNQRIQMLNFCIKKNQEINLSRNSEDDEFYDCENQSIKNEEYFEGRKKNFHNIKSLTSGNQLYIPYTLEFFPVSGKCLQQYDDESEKYETFKQTNKFEGNDLLESDMKAFKAANPGCCFEDFIRWYSPRDFIEEIYDENTKEIKEKAHLSDRFQTEECAWTSLWKSCEAVSISRQNCFLNYTMEAEKILKEFESLQISDLYKLLLPVLSHISILKYNSIVQELNFSVLNRKFNVLTSKFSNACSKLNKSETKETLYEIDSLIYKHLAVNELIKRAHFKLETKNKLKINENLKLALDLVPKLVEQEEISFPIQLNTYFNLLFKTIFSLNEKHTAIYINQQNDSLEDYEYREFIFTVQKSRPAVKYSKCLPQRMHCVAVKNSLFKLTSSFADDIIYF